MTDESPEAELERLREHNKQLLAELKTAKSEARSATEAATSAHKARDDWKARWYALEVAAPLESDLRGCAVGPWKYLRDTATESGLLTMEADDEGIERPRWTTADGKSADLSRGLYYFLSTTYSADVERFEQLGHCLRSDGITGGGARPSTGTMARDTPHKSADDHKQAAPVFGLR